MLQDNVWTQAWTQLGRDLPRPKEILVVSAHWQTVGIAVTAMRSPPTIHDFSGFPARLQQWSYPAPGSPSLARAVRELLSPLHVHLDEHWGLDHGAWAVLCKLYPQADVPVVQMSLDMTQPAAFHFEVGSRLASLRDQGVLVLCSGNVVHNLMLHRRGEDMAYDWAVAFNDHIRGCLLEGRLLDLIDFGKVGVTAAMAVPTPEHFYPLLYAAGAADGDPASVIVDGVFSGSMSMMSVMFGQNADEGK